MGIRTHNGSQFQCNTVNRILRNRSYCGYYISGEIVSPHLPNLQIIDEDIYDKAQIIMTQRSAANEQKTQMALNTKGRTLLSGNIYCAHCGSHLIATSYMDKYKRVDGSIYEVRKHRYICCNRSRHRGVCDGQTGYLASRIDGAVDMVVREYLDRIKTTAKSVALEKRYHDEIAEMKSQQQETEKEHRKLSERLLQLTVEISKSLTGESKYTPDMLSMAIENVKVELQRTEDMRAQLNYGLNNSQGAMKKLDHYYEQFRSWAEEFEDADLAERKMIICQLIREINVSKGYELDVVLDLNYEQFLSA